MVTIRIAYTLAVFSPLLFVDIYRRRGGERERESLPGAEGQGSVCAGIRLPFGIQAGLRQERWVKYGGAPASFSGHTPIHSESARVTRKHTS